MMHVRVRETGDRDVVLIHGIPGSARSWDAVVQHLPPDIRYFVPDLIGFGESERSAALEELHAEGQARRLEEALRNAGAKRPLLVGHDFGGPVALRLLMRSPENYSGLVLAATNTFTDTPIPFPLSLVTSPSLGSWFTTILFSRTSLSGMCRFGARKRRVNVPSAVGDRAQSLAIRIIFSGSLQKLQELYRPIEEALSQIRIPVLVLWGDHDPFFPISQAERTAAAIPGAKVQIFPGCGHFLPEEEPETFASVIAALAK